MSHNYADDIEYTRSLLKSSLRYVGLLGSKRRSQQIIEDIQDVPAECMAKLFAPVGLDIGAAGPQEIAVSIVAEIMAVLRGRSGGHLKSIATLIRAIIRTAQSVHCGPLLVVLGANAQQVQIEVDDVVRSDDARYADHSEIGVDADFDKNGAE